MNILKKDSKALPKERGWEELQVFNKFRQWCGKFPSGAWSCVGLQGGRALQGLRAMSPSEWTVILGF